MSINKLIEHIDNLILSLWNSTYTFWLTCGLIFIKPFKKILYWSGGILAEGAIKKFVEKCSEVFNEILDKKITEHEKKIEKRFKQIEKSIDAYKNEKHNLEGELLYTKSAIIENDIEALKIIRETYKKNEK